MLKITRISLLAIAPKYQIAWISLVAKNKISAKTPNQRPKHQEIEFGCLSSTGPRITNTTTIITNTTTTTTTTAKSMIKSQNIRRSSWAACCSTERRITSGGRHKSIVKARVGSHIFFVTPFVSRLCLILEKLLDITKPLSTYNHHARAQVEIFFAFLMSFNWSSLWKRWYTTIHIKAKCKKNTNCSPRVAILNEIINRVKDWAFISL